MKLRPVNFNAFEARKLAKTSNDAPKAEQTRRSELRGRAGWTNRRPLARSRWPGPFDNAMSASQRPQIKDAYAESFTCVCKLLSALFLTLNCDAQGLVDQSFVPPGNVVRLDTQVGIAPFFAGSQTF